MSQMPDWEDARVQIVYGMLADMEPHLEGKPDNEHWEGWMARKIVAALAEKHQEWAQEKKACLYKIAEPDNPQSNHGDCNA